MQRLKLIFACAQDIWQPHLGDATVGGYALTALYIVASLMFLRVVVARDGWLPRERLLWLVCTAVLVLMTVNKQLDLQQTLIWVGRCVARNEGWLDQRLVFQRNFGLMVLTLVAIAVMALGWACRGVIAANWRLILGMALLTGFVILQVARFEQQAGSLGHMVVKLRLHRPLEGAALVTLIWAAWRRLAVRD